MPNRHSFLYHTLRKHCRTVREQPSLGHRAVCLSTQCSRLQNSVMFRIPGIFYYLHQTINQLKLKPTASRKTRRIFKGRQVGLNGHFTRGCRYPLTPAQTYKTYSKTQKVKLCALSFNLVSWSKALAGIRLRGTALPPASQCHTTCQSDFPGERFLELYIFPPCKTCAS